MDGQKDGRQKGINKKECKTKRRKLKGRGTKDREAKRATLEQH